jgi:WD40 repeat protein
LWDLATLQEVATLEGQGTYFYYTAFSPDGNVLTAINQQGAVHLWRAPSLAAIAQGAAAPAPIPSSTPSEARASDP